MGTSVLKCPLCCGETFTCQKSLSDHLLNLTFNLVCPTCSSKFEEISELVTHLAGKNGVFCKNYSDNSIKTIEASKETAHFSKSSISNVYSSSSETQEVKEEMEKISLKRILESEDCQENDVDNQKVTLLGEDSESHIIIVAEQSDSEDGIEESLIETEDGTKNDMEVVSSDDDAQILSHELEEGLYSCTSCSMNFTSVIEHIQTYHTDQEVVLEMTEDSKFEAGECNDAMSFLQAMENKTDPLQLESDNKTIKYIITNEGDIVEADEDVKQPIAVEKASKVARKGGKQPRASVKEEPCFDKDGRQYTRRIIRIEKFWEDEMKDKEKPSDKKKIGSYPGTVRIPQVSSGNSSLMLDVGPNDATEVEQKNRLVMFQCATCYVTLNANQVKEHVCYTAPYKYACPHCPVSYASPKSLCAHMKIHKEVKSQEKKAKQSASDPNLATFRCDTCDTIFPSNKSLRLHGRMHEPLRSRHVDAPVHYLSEHKDKDENGDILNTVSGELSVDSPVQKSDNEDGHKDMYLCLLCDKWIHCGYREIHNNYHTSGNEFNCDICNRKFFTAENLMMHMNVHNNEKTVTQAVDKVLPYQCLYCNRQFTRPHEKVKHERIHTGEKPHSCDICGKSFRVSYCLTLHMRTHTGARPYVCGHCGKRFKAHSVYNHHLLTHSDVRAYKCCFCPKAFKTSVQLAGHKNSHTKPFACTQCNRPFASLYAVRVHMETHQRQNNLKYCCGLCGASYARAFALKDHVRSQHSCEMVEYSPSNMVEDLPSEGPSVSFDTKESSISFDTKDSLPKFEPEDSVATLSILPKNEYNEVTQDMDINCTQEIELLGDPLGT